MLQVRSQIKTALEVAGKELADEEASASVPEPAVVAAEVEAALSKAWGGLCTQGLPCTRCISSCTGNCGSLLMVMVDKPDDLPVQSDWSIWK